MVDMDKIRQKIAIIEDNLGKLEIIKKFSFSEFSEDFMKIESAKHLLQVAIEAMLDIANHIIARERISTPSSSSDAFRLLNEKGILVSSSADNYRLMAKFRNRMVHIYTDINIEEVYKIIQENLDDFRNYIREIISYLM